MKQYLDLLKAIQEKGTYKPAARKGMPGTTSLFGYQMRFDLQEGFPILSTKKISFKNIIVELLWFLRGDSNIKFMTDNKCNIWNEDAFNYMQKIARKQDVYCGYENTEEGKKAFDNDIRNGVVKIGDEHPTISIFYWGDTGKQYPWLWRSWGEEVAGYTLNENGEFERRFMGVDQISDLIKGLKNNPMSRRHIITAWNPATLDDMALNACHSFVQFNCRPLKNDKRFELLKSKVGGLYSNEPDATKVNDDLIRQCDKNNIPKYYLDCQLYQRSVDSVLGMPYNISSYALLTEIIAHITNMLSGEFIHTSGDAHIYDNHKDVVEEQLTRTPDEKSPKLLFKDEFHYLSEYYDELDGLFFNQLTIDMFKLEGYNPYPPIKAELSTGLN